MRLIDADNLRNSLDPQIQFIIDKAPTIDAKPVVHASWIAEYRMTCSACKVQFDDDIYWVQGGFTAPRFCPSCGAQMDAKEEGESDA